MNIGTEGRGNADKEGRYSHTDTHTHAMGKEMDGVRGTGCLLRANMTTEGEGCTHTPRYNNIMNNRQTEAGREGDRKVWDNK